MSFDIKRATQIKALHTEFSEPASCYLNIRKQVQKRGGRTAFGWLKTDVIFWERPKIQTWIHHCVWESPEGKLFELTPFVQKVIDDSIIATLSDTSIFIPDDDAQLIKHPDGRFQSLTPQYTAIVNSEEAEKGIECMKAADKKLRQGDVRGEAYWCERASQVLGGWIQPLGELGVKTMTPFTLDDDEGN